MLCPLESIAATQMSEHSTLCPYDQANRNCFNCENQPKRRCIFEVQRRFRVAIAARHKKQLESVAKLSLMTTQEQTQYDAEIAQLEARYRDFPVGNILFYGSSSMRLWPRLAQDFPGITLENWGFGGATLAQCALYFERIMAQRKPRAIVFYAGDNDLALGAAPGDVLDSLTALLDARDARFGAFPLAFLSLKPSPARLELGSQIAQLNEWCWREMEARENAAYVDIFAPMLNGNRAPRPELYAPDGLHLSRAGYALWREILTREVSWLGSE